MVKPLAEKYKKNSISKQDLLKEFSLQDTSRSNTDGLLIDLLREDAITLEDLSDFSEEFQESMMQY